MRKRPALPPVTEEMRRWSALLAEEILRWPGTRVGRMFGMLSLYRNDKIFALLPDKRAMGKPNAIAIKLHSVTGTEGKKWQSVDVDSDGKLRAALDRLEEAYRSAEDSLPSNAK